MTDSKEVDDLIEERATEFYQKMSSPQNQQQGKVCVTMASLVPMSVIL